MNTCFVCEMRKMMGETLLKRQNMNKKINK
jgi:hypothetical protein